MIVVVLPSDHHDGGSVSSRGGGSRLASRSDDGMGRGRERVSGRHERR